MVKFSSSARLIAALKQSAKARDLETGKSIHAAAVEAGYVSNPFVATSLINMYAKCGSFDEARKLFESLPDQGFAVFAWTSLVSGYAEHGQELQAVELLDEMQARGCFPNAHTFAAAVKACSNLAARRKNSKLLALENGMRVHSRAANTGCVDVFLANSLIDMYSKCGSLLDARLVFDRMQRHDVVSWTSLVLGSAQNGEGEAGFELFTRMRSARCVPTPSSFVAALKACCSIAGAGSRGEALEKGRRVHSEASISAYDHSDAIVSSSLIEMYGSCGSLEEARNLFDRVCHRGDVIVWNSMLLAYVQSDAPEAGLELFHRLLEQAQPQPNAQSFVSALKACCALAGDEEGKKLDGRLMKLEALDRGAEIHAHARRSGLLSDMLVATSLVDFYARCGDTLGARSVFDAMPKRDIVVWTSLLLGYVQAGQSELALQMFEQMQGESCSPDSQCLVTILRACLYLASREEESSRALALEQATRVRDQATRLGFNVAHAMVEFYSKFGLMNEAEREFERVWFPDAAACWTSLIQGYAQAGRGEDSLRSLSLMQLEGCAPAAQTYIAALKACSSVAGDSLKRCKAIHSQLVSSGYPLDVFITSALIDLYSKSGSMIDAERVFSSAGVELHNVVSWTALILGYSQNSDPETSIQRFLEMQNQECPPDAQTLAIVLKSCGELVVTGGEELNLHKLVLQRGFETNLAVITALVGLYSKCGDMTGAQLVFDSTPVKKTIETWSSLMGGYARQGETKLVFGIFVEIVESGLGPDGIVFTHLFTACSHVGLVETSRRVFRVMSSRFGVDPELEHYHGLIDCCGRANRLQEAVEIIEQMPVEPSSVTWMTLLSSCHKWRNVDIARRAFTELVKIDEDHAQAYVLMANINSGGAR